MYIKTGYRIILVCGHVRVVMFNDPHDTRDKFWCDRCDGMRETARTAANG